MTSIDDFVKKIQIKKIYRKPEELARLEKLQSAKKMLKIQPLLLNVEKSQKEESEDCQSDGLDQFELVRNKNSKNLEIPILIAKNQNKNLEEYLGKDYDANDQNRQWAENFKDTQPNYETQKIELKPSKYLFDKKMQLKNLVKDDLNYKSLNFCTVRKKQSVKEIPREQLMSLKEKLEKLEK